MDILLDKTGCSFSNGDFALVRNPKDEVSQRLFVRFRTTKGKWFLDTVMGIDWFGKVFGKRKNKIQVDALIQQELKKEPLVLSVDSFTSKVVDRAYSCNFIVRTENMGSIPISAISTQNGISIEL